MKDKFKLISISSVTASCIVITYYFIIVLEKGTVYTHSFYIPIILACMWWGRKGFYVSVFLSIFLLLNHLFFRTDDPWANDIGRALMFCIVGFIASIIGEKRNVAENELERKNLQLEKANRIKSEFLANMSHELRTPLNSIIGFTSIILQGMAGELNEEQKKQLTMVYDSSKHLLELINGLLDLSKIESGKMTYISEKFDIRNTIEDALDMVSPMIKKKGLELSREISEEVGYIYSDEKKIKQILINLLNNAIKFTDRGEIELKCRMVNNDIKISVSDTGIGIKKEDIEFIFDEFRQIDGTLTRERGGTGLGLSISKKFIEALGGSIWCESEYGKSSKFTFTIPIGGKK